MSNKTSNAGQNLLDLAYDKLEELIVTCELKPGSHLRIQDLQTMTGFNRMPVYQATTRLAADTLMIIHPRQGVQISPIDLSRASLLLDLRRDLERFVISLASQRASDAQRSQFRHIANLLKTSESLTISEFNAYDSKIDQMVLSACGEPFLQYTLRPLHTIFRRIGWVYHSYTAGGESLDSTVEGHIAVLDAILSGKPEQAALASDKLIDFVKDMLPVLSDELPPSVFDVRMEFKQP
ncbi:MULTISPECIES: GntR family transcriptional regulator [Halomonadaceae]|jgi:DNA-binding GntR family transcriptional regulator|uniref:GntR family transcriptional regulator n=1 Tax=Halomonadaceae TaxID=28256 RepID=UPI00068679E6|nr:MULTISPECIES: GntR family transcriptional regulator [Halomonas]NAO97434.1 FCD domain-containing protein [Halomonas sp. MG34]UEQ05877.1 GntR family transcriptional regulator [Halomonas profundus]MCD1585404.1 GntR family transcriptional regulator [Halomonas sp. IOP_14]MCE7519532.1 GntR family transcriptional regulator [Halomonas titanicae]NVE89408.1 GntR family transcriptional regulator [Halomonas titanicae]|tara:strand:- start:1292 stop:2002 length:711 start_codon:yes stop_codon:yes gene_type:complete